MGPKVSGVVLWKEVMLRRAFAIFSTFVIELWLRDLMVFIADERFEDMVGRAINVGGNVAFTVWSSLSVSNEALLYRIYPPRVCGS